MKNLIVLLALALMACQRSETKGSSEGPQQHYKTEQLNTIDEASLPPQVDVNTDQDCLRRMKVILCVSDSEKLHFDSECRFEAVSAPMMDGISTLLL